MSFSFHVKAASKAAAKEQIAVELDRVVQAQPDHSRDRAQAESTASASIDLLDREPGEGEVLNVSVSGSLGGKWDNGLTEVTAAQLSVNAYFFKADA